MSHWIRQEGTIKLPTAEFARVRQSLQDADTEVKTQAFEIAQKFWESTGGKLKKDPQAYAAACQALQEEIRRLPESVTDKVQDLTDTHYGRAPRRPLKKDLAIPNSKTLDFNAGYGTDISLDRETSTLSWHSDVSSNTERPEDSVVGQAMYKALDSVKWTRGTGGHFRGWDEYSSEAGNGSAPNEAFGPLGKEEAPFKCRPYQTSTGLRMTSKAVVQETVHSMRKQTSGGSGPQGRRTSGQFDFVANQERGGRL